MNKQNLYSLQELKCCHFHVYQLPTYLAASSTEPQFQAPLPPLLSSGGIPLQLRQNDHQYTVTRQRKIRDKRHFYKDLRSIVPIVFPLAPQNKVVRVPCISSRPSCSPTFDPPFASEIKV